MTEILFYHLQKQPLAKVLPALLEKSLERGWTALVQVTTPERLAALDDHLWTYSEESFLPHGTDQEPNADHPVTLSLTGANPNGASVLFLVEGAPLPADIDAFRRLVLLFDGTDPDALALARDQWRAIRDAGREATYWQQDERGQWQRKA
jgi:DNA polymerase III subunit chi